MEAWFMLLVSLSIAAILKAFFKILIPTKQQILNLPPSPSTIPIITDILWLFKSLTGLESILKSIIAKLGPIVTLDIGFRRIIFVEDHSIAHQALVRNGAVFASRPPSLATTKIVNSNQSTINTSLYGPTWRLLRRNLTSQILHPTRSRSYSHARKWVIQILMDRLLSESQSEEVMLDQYLIPKNSTVNFMVAQMGWDPKVWEDPMGFKPERFMSSDGEVVFDITGNKEIKMMPFGVGLKVKKSRKIHPRSSCKLPLK
ncbi:hypothetical protein HS088_TW15G00801 [Tripterygium wilfordii]|uniref:Cytochrome P450 89A2-like n=1 Tax=Tripterygium wilfordii TaxID=458696 RepID=A0A7J7CMP5_TRIWF|nr:hypothetical protein HS088_TW15G00801 [Tripterygium wilfordii]